MWQTTKLNQVCKIVSGNSVPAKEKEQLFTGVEGMPYVATKDVGFDGNINYQNGIAIPDEYLSKFKVSPAGATLVCAEGGSAGRKIAFSFEDCCYVNKLFSLQPDEKIIPKFIYYYTLSIEFQSQFKNAMHGLIGGVSLSKIKDFSISIPPLAEQQRIVAKLDAAFAEIDKAIVVSQSQITQAHILFENIVAEQFSHKEGYNQKTLQDICEKITDGTHQTPKYYDGGYIFLSSKNVTSRKIDWENIKYVDESQHIEMQKHLSPKVGDVLLAKNGTTGVAALVDRNVVFNIYVSLAWLRSKGDVTPEFLLNFVNSKVARQQFSKRTKGIGVPNLHLKEIREVEISFPTKIREQCNIVSKVSNIDEAYLNYCGVSDAKLKNLQTLKLAILAQELQSEVA